MRYRIWFGLFTCAALLGPAAARSSEAGFSSRAEVVQWMDEYRRHPEPMRLPAAIKTLSDAGALREPENAGYYTGFAAGVLGANGAQADGLVERMALPPSDQWIVVRAIAYSGLPSWRALMARTTALVPAKRGLVDAYLSGALPALDKITVDDGPDWIDKLGEPFGYGKKEAAVSFARNPELTDTLWGVYFATGKAAPLARIVALLPWSKERDGAERLAVGSAAKYTLANNAARYPDVLIALKTINGTAPPKTQAILREVIKAAETMETAAIRKDQLARIERMKGKGTGTQQDVKLWATVGQGAIGITCVTLAVMSVGAAGVPCVIGGAATSAALSYWGAQ